MKEWRGKKYWIVGASEGLGRAVAFKLSRAGAHLILSARGEARLTELSQELPGPSEVLPVDIGDTDSVAKAAATLDGLDGVVFLAGVYWPMKTQEWNAEQAIAMCDINFTGAVRVLGHVVPQMVERGHGHIVLTGSLSGFRGLPGAIGYGASKAGVMHLAENLQADLKDHDIEVQVINPGFIETRLTEKNEFSMPFIMKPEAAAEQFFEHMNSDNFKKNFPFWFGSMFRLNQFLPDWLYYRLFA